jgi:hypothetical protein
MQILGGFYFMRNFGITLLILGIGSFILPYFGYQFKIFNSLGEYEKIVEIGVAVLGAVLIAVSIIQAKKKETETDTDAGTSA